MTTEIKTLKQGEKQILPRTVAKAISTDAGENLQTVLNELSNNDEVLNRIGTTTDTGATSLSGTLMGKVNLLLEGNGGNSEGSNDFYYLSDTAKDTIFDTTYTLKSGASSSQSYKYMYLGNFVAQKDGIITVVYNGKIAHQSNSNRGHGTFYACIARGGTNVNGSTYNSGSTSALSYDMISSPIGSTSKNWDIPRAGRPIVFGVSNTSNSNYKFSINVRKGESIFFFGYVEDGESDEGSHYRTTLTSNSLKIAYADAPQQ